MTRSILDARICVWSPMDPRDPYIAFIEGDNLKFSAPSAMKAKKAAEEWRRAEVVKHHKSIEAYEAKVEKAKSARAARAAAKEVAA